MYFKDKGNTDIDENLKYAEENNDKSTFQKLLPYLIFFAIFLFGILLIYIASKM